VYSRKQDINRDEKSQFDLADQLQDLHATILARLDELDEMRSNLREDYVPSSVCQNLEQCLKDTEVRQIKEIKCCDTPAPLRLGYTLVRITRNCQFDTKTQSYKKI